MSPFIQKLLARAPNQDDLSTSREGSGDELIIENSNPVLPAGWSVGTALSVGQQRLTNQDTLFTTCSELHYDNKRCFCGFFIVADGMGGHQNGELASEAAARAMGEWVVEQLYLPYLRGEPSVKPEDLLELMAQGISQANQAVQKSASGGGTTLSSTLIYGDQIYVAHVGDSRIYYIDPSGSIETLSHDHSYVQQLVDMGHITPAEALVHPQRNVLYQALGQIEPLEPEIAAYDMPNSGHLLLCSDGLWGVVPDGLIADIVHNAASPQAGCQELIDAANEAGGPDNITAVLVNLPG